MTFTQSTLNQLCRNLLGDTGALAYTFTNDQINAWINLAIQDLSMHFPRLADYEISAVAGTRLYDLPSTAIGLLSVEYPAQAVEGEGDEAPRFLLRRSYTHPDFLRQAGFYDVLMRQDQDSSYPPQLLLSSSPADGETIRVKYKAEHNLLSDPGDECTLLDRHVHLAALFVRWKAMQELSSSEASDPDAILHIISDSELNAGRAEKAYLQALQDALRAESESGRVTGWRMDRHDRVY
jgi:hypothetical protein